jgi:hypothetical protein
MIVLDYSTLFVLIIACVLSGLMLGLLPTWRRMMTEGGELPIWHFLPRNGIRRAEAEKRLGPRGILHAELRCTLCGVKSQCLQRLAEGEDTPVAQCPNAELFERPGAGRPAAV